MHIDIYSRLLTPKYRSNDASWLLTHCFIAMYHFFSFTGAFVCVLLDTCCWVCIVSLSFSAASGLVSLCVSVNLQDRIAVIAQVWVHICILLFCILPVQLGHFGIGEHSHSKFQYSLNALTMRYFNVK